MRNSSHQTILKIVRLSVAVCMLGITAVADWTSPAFADPGDDCVLVAEQSPISIMVYREVGDSQKGAPVWRKPVDLLKGGSQRIFHGQAGTSKRLRFDYGNLGDAELHGNVGFTCSNNKRVIVP